ncbi:MAG: hypothetical protein R3C10_16660 [Pirellulales bacterium]
MSSWASVSPHPGLRKMPSCRFSLATLLKTAAAVALGLAWRELVTRQPPELAGLAVLACGGVPTVVTLRRRRCPGLRRALIGVGLAFSWLSLAANSALIAEAWQLSPRPAAAGVVFLALPLAPLFIGLPILFIVREWHWAKHDARLMVETSS